MRAMYHITSIENWDSIKRNGLIPQYGFLSDMALECSPGIYMFLDKKEVVYALQNWFGNMIRYVYDLDDLILLEIHLPDTFEIRERFGWEAISHTVIPSECIKLVQMPKYDRDLENKHNRIQNS